ncbi:MAG: sugar MFS transporter [Planctomycetota bacterium]
MRRESWLAAAGYLCLFASGFSDNARGPLFPKIIESFKVTDAECSLLVVIGSLAGLPGSLAAGALVARSGPRATMRLSGALVALGLLLVAASGLVAFFPLVPIGAGVLGLGLGGLGVCANACVALATPPERRARALALLHVTYAVASLIVPLAIDAAAKLARWPFVLGAVALVPLALLPASISVPDPEKPADEKAAEKAARAKAPLGVVVPYALVVSCFVVAEVAVSVWIVLYAARVKSPWPGPVLLAGFFVGLGAARALGGALLRAEMLRPVIAAAALLTAGLVLLGLHVDALFLSFAGLTAGILFPATVTALTLELAPEHHGPAIGVVSGAYSAALGGAHALIGKISDARGLEVALHVSPICALAGVAVFLFHTRRRNP